MIKSIPVRVGILAVLILVALITLYPSMVQKDEVGRAILPEWWNKLGFLPKKRINLGLDLRGGIYLVYTVQLDKVAQLEGENVLEELESSEYQEEGINIAESSVSGDGVIRVTFADETSFQKGGKKAEERFSRIWNIEADPDKPLTLVFKIKETELIKAKQNAIQQVRRTVMSRINEWGLAETSVQIKGQDQLVVELPGVTDTKRVKEVINTTANLELKLVVESGGSPESIEQAQGGRIPRHMAVYEKVNPQTKLVDEYFLLKKIPDLTGECISNAYMGYGGQFGTSPVVYFDMKPGAECEGKFARLTGANIGKRLAIVLDNKVISAPVIRARISSSGVIEGRFTAEEATDLAVVLKTGSLSVPLREDRVERIGPSLGKDHIRRGEIALIIGTLLVVVFMVIYYKLAGAMADVALILNVMFILAALATFGATLTLPGIAGIVLTVGMAVDANVLINERIREELRSGKTPQSAVELGYNRALATILDSNITTFITGLVLYLNGTGPIKGFAVTLMFGIVSSVFTAIFVTRIMFDYRLQTRPGAELSI